MFFFFFYKSNMNKSNSWLTDWRSVAAGVERTDVDAEPQLIYDRMWDYVREAHAGKQPRLTAAADSGSAETMTAETMTKTTAALMALPRYSEI